MAEKEYHHSKALTPSFEPVEQKVFNNKFQARQETFEGQLKKRLCPMTVLSEWCRKAPIGSLRYNKYSTCDHHTLGLFFST